MDMLVLRLAGPMLSFGAPIVDNRGAVQEHPPLSMLTGLLGNALGFRHGESDRLQRLQARIRFAARCDRPGEQFTDYQTVDLGQSFMRRTGWTTRGEREDRRGGPARTDTHIRHRRYLADAAYTVAVTLRPPDEPPTLDEVEEVLARPARPLFIGRKTCLPSRRLLAGRIDAPDVLEALRTWPLDRAAGPSGKARDAEAWWPADLDASSAARSLTVTDERDWSNQIHTGSRRLSHGTIAVEEAAGGA